jgi:hypothetical protein
MEIRINCHQKSGSHKVACGASKSAAVVVTREKGKGRGKGKGVEEM